MQNNNFSEYQDEEMEKENNNNRININHNVKVGSNSVKNNMLVCNKVMQDKILVTGNNLMLATNKKFFNNNNNNINILFANQNQSGASLSKKMKAKIQRTKELLEKKQYKASETLNTNEYYSKNNAKKFQYNLESALEFSELKNNNVCKKSECPDCLTIMNRINYINNNYQNNPNNNNINSNNSNNQKNLNSSSQANNYNNNNDAAAKNNSKQEKKKQNLTEKQTAEKSCEKKSDLTNTNNLNETEFENSAALVKSFENKINLDNESFSSNGTSKNYSCMDISLNENSFSGICNRNNLSKKELKMLRNRISAQKSRDRKKKEMDDLKLITQELFNQNIKLKKQLEEKENKISEFKDMFNSLCESCKGKINYLKNSSKNKSCANNYLLEENKFLTHSCLNSNNNNKYLDVGDSIELTNKKIENINELKNNLISNKRNRVVDFPTIMNSGNRRISSNVKCGIMTGFLVIACIVGSFAFNYGNSFANNQNEDFIVKQSGGFVGRILQEISNEELVKSGNYSSKLNIKFTIFIYLFYFFNLFLISEK